MPTNDNAPSAKTALVDAMAQSAFLTMGVLTRLAAENDLSLTQLRVLAILRDRQLKIGDLARYLGLEKSTLTGLVSRAEKQGLMHRRPSTSDHRGVVVGLSEDGEDVAERLARELTDLVDPLLDPLAPSEREDLRRLLTKVTDPATRSA